MRGAAVKRLLEPVLAQGAHALLDGDLADLRGRGALQDSSRIRGLTCMTS